MNHMRTPRRVSRFGKAIFWWGIYESAALPLSYLGSILGSDSITESYVPLSSSAQRIWCMVGAYFRCFVVGTWVESGNPVMLAWWVLGATFRLPELTRNVEHESEIELPSEIKSHVF